MIRTPGRALLALLLALPSLALAEAPTARRPMTVEDLWSLQGVGAPALSTDPPYRMLNYDLFLVPAVGGPRKNLTADNPAAGGSYGGFLVNWIEGHTDRFAALVSHAGVYDLMGQFASDDTYGRNHSYGGYPFTNRDAVEAWSPNRFASLKGQNAKHWYGEVLGFLGKYLAPSEAGR